MKRKIGSLLFFIGFASLIYTGISYINETESLGFLGMDVVVSQGDLTPMVLSAVVMIFGIILTSTAK